MIPCLKFIRKNKPAVRRIHVVANMSLDGVILGPEKPDGDHRSDFQYGGWAAHYDTVDFLNDDDYDGSFIWRGLLMGRCTYEILYDTWAKQTNNPFTERLNKLEKYVVSTTLTDPLAWQNTTLIKDNVAEAVTALKAKLGDAWIVIGSSKLTQSLMKYQLINRYILYIHPLVVGTGQRLFDDTGQSTRLRLVAAGPTEHRDGVVEVVYVPA
jgi:dihydrofolate reductase